MATETSVLLASSVRIQFAGRALTARQAKLYSQRLRKDMGREGLASFAQADIASYIDEAVLLLECALLERHENPASAWRDGIKRAAELLEWLSQPDLKPNGAPLHLLAAAAYQLADLPAMALGHLRKPPIDEPISAILREYLRANFPATLDAVREFWRRDAATDNGAQPGNRILVQASHRHVVMCVGTVCMQMRTGNVQTSDRAVVKLEKLARVFLHSDDPYSYLLATLIAGVSRRYTETCYWPHIARLRANAPENTGEALNQFARAAFVNCRALVWPAQRTGIERLVTNDSFVLCTPTGSGKTTVATLAVVQGLFATTTFEALGFEGLPGNIVLYLVPSRALAAEVETRLAQDLAGIAAEPVVVTGLYGGIDWGPTDVWVQSERPTIVVCTFEKADALLRYLGVLFLHRVRLVIIDEAHMVEEATRQTNSSEQVVSRPYRLEQLGSRLLRARDNYNFRVIALSAVAARAAPALARWISGGANEQPTASDYRSTRQMVGCLQVSREGHFEIRYDLMDGKPLRFNDERPGDTPYVRRPIAQLAEEINLRNGPEVRMRVPTLWAALQLAAQRPDGSKPTVLISITQRIEHFASTCNEALDRFDEATLPNYHAINMEDSLWIRCLATVADYFTTESVEYKLLLRGIAVHHGKMPGLLARRLKLLIDKGYVRVIIATSTLSEGVNLPVNYILIPSVYRNTQRFDLQEFTNLIGRAGRAGVATEGSALVVLPEVELVGGRPAYNRQRSGYAELVAEIEHATSLAGAGEPEDEGSSPLMSLLRALENSWIELFGEAENNQFFEWLENTALPAQDVDFSKAHDYLDSLDAFLVAGIQEVEELRQAELSPAQLEEELLSIWRKTYAFAARHDEDRLRGAWMARGHAIKTHYPDADERRRIYKTSLSPRSARPLLRMAETLRHQLQGGENYSGWSTAQRLEYICDVLSTLSEIPLFKIKSNIGNADSRTWKEILQWWLAKTSLDLQPQAKDITKWYSFVAGNFIYRGTWGLGSILGVLMDIAEGFEPVQPLEIEDWPRSGLPWIAFWLKELIAWGTLDPVAAFLLARGNAIDRPQAEADAHAYYESLDPDIEPNDVLDPRRIRDWMSATQVPPEPARPAQLFTIDAILARPEGDYLERRVTVMPVEIEGALRWIDSAGYTVARSEIPAAWGTLSPTFDFVLSVAGAQITGSPYLSYV